MKSKGIILVVIYFLFNANIKAQTNVYHPFPDSNAVWRERSSVTISYGGGGGGGCPSSNVMYYGGSYQYTIGGDTVINPYTYKKIYASGFCWVCNDPAGWFYNYVGGLRQDSTNKKVYFKYTGYPDKLIYDFSKQVGDTLNLTAFYVVCGNSPFGNPTIAGYTATITSIDTVLVGSNYHKQFQLNNASCCNNNNNAIIEGVGSRAGLLEGAYYPLPSGYQGCKLVCFKHNAAIYPVEIQLFRAFITRKC